MTSDMLYQKKYLLGFAGKLGDADLWQYFIEGTAEVENGVSQYEESMDKLRRLIKKSLSDRQTNQAILTRRYAAVMQRLHELDQAVFRIRGGYSNIWEALEDGLGQSALKTLSAQARAGGKAKAAKAKDKPNPEREAATKLATDQPTLSATQIKMRLGLRASDRTIRGWIKAVKE